MTVSVQITHKQGDFTLDAAFDAPDGLTVLFGRSGSGKTSVINAIAGLLRPDAGRIAGLGVHNRDPTPDPPRYFGGFHPRLRQGDG